ncbi:MAG: thermonuclease family protein [Planctomycetota bacterium]|nr:thermonuclease family protein [Planctomycetota bacterium]MDI6786835.1 thermonuclease family protein [Planctomycetota bacterium]
MKAKKWLLVGILLFIIVGCLISSLVSLASQQPPPKYPVKDFKEQTAYKIIRVVDGDTILLLMDNKEVKVRLKGIDTPETVHPDKPVEKWGKEASKFLTNLLKGEEVYIEYDKEKPELDKYERLLAYLYRVPDGLFVNLEIVRQGYGEVYRAFPFKYMEIFNTYEKRARDNKKGLWSPPETGKKDTK